MVLKIFDSGRYEDRLSWQSLIAWPVLRCRRRKLSSHPPVSRGRSGTGWTQALVPILSLFLFQSPSFLLPWAPVGAQDERASRIDALDLAAHGALHGGPRGVAVLRLVPLPLLRGLALGAPRVDGGDLLLKGGVDGAVALQRVQPGELGRHDQGGEGLSATTYEGCRMTG